LSKLASRLKGEQAGFNLWRADQAADACCSVCATSGSTKQARLAVAMVPSPAVSYRLPYCLAADAASLLLELDHAPHALQVDDTPEIDVCLKRVQHLKRHASDIGLVKVGRRSGCA